MARNEKEAHSGPRAFSVAILVILGLKPPAVRAPLKSKLEVMSQMGTKTWRILQKNAR